MRTRIKTDIDLEMLLMCGLPVLDVYHIVTVSTLISDLIMAFVLKVDNEIDEMHVWMNLPSIPFAFVDGEELYQKMFLKPLQLYLEFL